MKFSLLILFALFIISQESKSAECFQGDTLFFHSQDDINAFGEDYKECKNLDASIVIDPINSEINTLQPLENIESLSGVLIIKNTNLIRFTGLHNLYRVGFGVSIVNNNSIIGLTGLNNLNMIGQESEKHIDEVGFLEIVSNDNLINLWGIDNLDSLMGDLVIKENRNLFALDGLESLQKLNGFRFNGEAIVKPNVYVVDNEKLTRCSVMGICALRDYTDFIFEGNEEDCNNIANVQAGCSFISVESKNLEETAPYPNPTSGIVNIDNNKQISNVKISNYLGEVVYQDIDATLSFIDISNEPTGVYYITINDKVYKIMKK